MIQHILPPQKPLLYIIKYLQILFGGIAASFQGIPEPHFCAKKTALKNQGGKAIFEWLSLWVGQLCLPGCPQPGQSAAAAKRTWL